MNKSTYYGKRPNPLYPYNYVPSSFNGYIHPYKKNNFKVRSRPNNNPINNKYFENRNKNYYYNNNFNNSFNNNFINYNENQNFYHSGLFQKNRYSHRHTPHFTEEKKIAEEVNNDSVNEEEKKEELLKIRVNISDTQCKELVILFLLLFITIWRGGYEEFFYFQTCRDHSDPKKTAGPYTARAC